MEVMVRTTSQHEAGSPLARRGQSSDRAENPTATASGVHCSAPLFREEVGPMCHKSLYCDQGLVSLEVVAVVVVVVVVVVVGEDVARIPGNILSWLMLYSQRWLAARCMRFPVLYIVNRPCLQQD